MDRYTDRVPASTKEAVPNTCMTEYGTSLWVVLEVLMAVDLKKSMLQEGDQVMVEYKNKTYRGVVEASSTSAGTC